MSYLGNSPGVSSQRVVTEEVISGSAKSDFYPVGGYALGYVDVLINGIEVDASDFTAANGTLVHLNSPAQVGDTVKIKCYIPRGLSDGYTKAEADAKYVELAGDTMTGGLTLGGLLNTGATGQIKFPAAQNASAEANTLDDYEEGSWTPIVGGTATYGANNVGRYTKVGNKVFFECILEITTIGTGDSVNVGGLPFVSRSANPQGSISVGYWQGLSLAIVYLGCTIAGNGTALNLRSVTGASGSLTGSSILQSGSAVFCSGQYTTN